MPRKKKNETQITENERYAIDSVCPVDENKLLELAKRQYCINVPYLQMHMKIGYHTAVKSLVWLIKHHQAFPTSVALPIL